jgi:hypothetical protein
MSLPANLVFLLLTVVVPTIGMSYYASKMLYMSRFGKLEKGWTLVTVGAI